jgi:hypothetical protein
MPVPLKPSIEVAARAARRLREQADSRDDLLGDPGPGRSALEQHKKPPEPSKSRGISAVREKSSSA